jgi:hypothetical protein
MGRTYIMKGTTSVIAGVVTIDFVVCCGVIVLSIRNSNAFDRALKYVRPGIET